MGDSTDNTHSKFPKTFFLKLKKKVFFLPPHDSHYS